MRIENVPYPVTQQIETQHYDENGEPGQGRNPPLIHEKLAAVADHESPFRCRRLCPQPQKPETGCCQNNRSHIEAHPHDDGGHAHGGDVACHDAQVAGPQRPNNLDIIVVLDAQRFRPGKPGIARPVGHGNCDDGIFYSWSKGGGKGDGQDKSRKRQKHIGQAHKNFVDGPTEPPGHNPDHQSQRRADKRHQKSDGQRYPGAVYDSGIDISSQAVGT